MKKIFKRFGVMFIVVAMLIAMIPMTALAYFQGEGFYYYQYGYDYSSERHVTYGDQFWITGSTDFMYQESGPGGNPRPANSWAYYYVNDTEDEVGMTCSDLDYVINVDELGIGHNESFWVTVISGTYSTDLEILKKTGVYDNTTYMASGNTVTVTDETTLTFYGENGAKGDAKWTVKDSDGKVSKEGTGSTFDVPAGTYYLDYYLSLKTVYLYDTKASIIPPKGNENLKYNGEDQKLIDTEARSLDGTTPMYKVTTVNEQPEKDDTWTPNSALITGKNADTYYIWCYAKANEGSGLDDSEVKGTDPVTIAQKEVPVPTENPGLVYDGTEQTGVDYVEDSTDYELVDGSTVAATNASDEPYVATFALKDNTDEVVNRVWEDDRTSEDRTVSWSIAQKEATTSDFIFTAPSSLYTGEDKDAKVDLVEHYGGVEYTVSYKNEELKDLGKGERQLPGKYFVLVKVNGGNFAADPKAITVGSFNIDPVKVTGDKSVFTKGSKDTITFTTNGPAKYFLGIKVNGNTVDKNFYEISEDGKSITLSNEYLNNLEAKEYGIVFVYNSDSKKQTSAYATFTVQEAASPKTGDTNSSLLWIVLASLALISLLGAAFKFIGSDI